MSSEPPESRTTTTQKRPCCHCRVNQYSCTKKFAIIFNDLKRDMKVLDGYYKTTGDPNLKCIQTILSSIDADLERIDGMVRIGQMYSDQTETVRGGSLFDKACAIKCMYKDLVSLSYVRNHLPNSEICKSFNKILTLEEGALRIGCGLGRTENREHFKPTNSKNNNGNRTASRVEMAYRSETARKLSEPPNYPIKAEIGSSVDIEVEKMGQKEIRRDILERDFERLMMSISKSLDTDEDSKIFPVKKTKSESHIEQIASSFQDSCSISAIDESLTFDNVPNEKWESADTVNDTQVFEEDFPRAASNVCTQPAAEEA